MNQNRIGGTEVGIPFGPGCLLSGATKTATAARGLFRSSSLGNGTAIAAENLAKTSYTSNISLGEKLWPSAGSKCKIINEIEYSTHALERMSPRGLIQKGTELVSRGVPPSVVENAIRFGAKSPGNTANEIIHCFENVRVVTNQDCTRVVTVITTGR